MRAKIFGLLCALLSAQPAVAADVTNPPATNPGLGAAIAKNVNFNSIADTPLLVSLPPGFTRFVCAALRLSGASGTLTTSQIGLFTTTGAGGTAIISGGTAVTVSTASDGTVNNAQSVNCTTGGAQSYLASALPTPYTVYFRVTQVQGSAATGSVNFVYAPIP